MEGQRKVAIGEATNPAPGKPAFMNLYQVREDQVQKAVQFLSHPKVRSYSVIDRQSFLENKGLSKEEIDEAFRRVPVDLPLPPSSFTYARTPVSTQVSQPYPLKAAQPLQAHHPMAPATHPMTAMVPAGVQRRFSWYHIVLATGIIAAGGTGTAIYFKRVALPKIKMWIKKVVSQREDEAGKQEKENSKLAEAAEAAKAATSATALLAKASQDLISSRNENKAYFEAFMRALDVQVKEMKLMGEAIKKLENKQDNKVQEDQFHHSTTRNGPVSNAWGAQPVNMNGIATAVYVKPSAPRLTESLNYESYMEPWETTPPVLDQRPNYTYTQSHLSDNGFDAEIKEPAYTDTSSITPNGTKINTTTESSSKPKELLHQPNAESESDDPKQFPYGSSGNNAGSRQTQKSRWVPPQAPSVAMPDAAAAIHPPTKEKSNMVFDEDADGTMVKADDVVPNDGGVGVSDMAEDPSNGV
ncbi:Peroxisomal membrane protein PEX14 [Rhynchospora pubera]|uniref:Peroxisomal membrane protein PEX14 n=1 Tax=Rhynchospora pubera TaxID=906938 RepID=A0AAV8G665_9POAL|nr:Peroxisomal membrane protein PEX14 [Rhynchospora pubera]